jgi:hypothetical protein
MNAARACSLLLIAVLLAPAYRLPAHELGVYHAELRTAAPDSLILTVRGADDPRYPLREPEVRGDCPGAQFIRMPAAGGVVRFILTGCEPGSIDSLRLEWPVQGLMLQVVQQGKAGAPVFVNSRGGRIDLPMGDLPGGGPGYGRQAGRYIALGMEHILLGFDHLLFVFSLLLLVRSPWMLVRTITAFTLAHSLTLALASLGLLSVPNNLVDVLVALSIVFAASEALAQRQTGHTGPQRRPWLLAFGFGLLHGLGFANALSALGLSRTAIPWALFTFNIGVEAGQLLFVGVFLALQWSVSVLEFPRPAWSRPLPAYATGLVATVWFFQRLAALFGA